MKAIELGNYASPMALDSCEMLCPYCGEWSFLEAWTSCEDPVYMQEPNGDQCPRCFTVFPFNTECFQTRFKPSE